MEAIVRADGRQLRLIEGQEFEVGHLAGEPGDSVSFEAQTESPKYGSLLWRGVVRGPRLDGTLTMVRDGKTLGEKWGLAGEKG